MPRYNYDKIKSFRLAASGPGACRYQRNEERVRQDPKIFYGRDDATGGVEDILSVPFTAHTLMLQGLHTETNDLWRMAENGWLEVLTSRSPQMTPKGKFLWYQRVPEHTMDLNEMMTLLDAQSRLR